MDDRERDIMEKLKTDTSNVSVPDSLKPKQIEKMLKDRKQKPVIRWKGWAAGLAAACCLAVVLFASGTWEYEGYNKVKDKVDTGKEIKTAQSYDEVYSYVKATRTAMEKLRSAEQNDVASADMEIADTEALGSAGWGGASEETAYAEDNPGEAKTTASEDSGSAAKAEGSYSETNVRQQGVDEADVVKTDGRYIYTLTDNQHTVSIVDTKDDLAVIGEINSESDYIEEFYVKDGRLIIVYNTAQRYGVNPLARDSEETRVQSTSVVTYDVTDGAKPEKLGTVVQSGYYSSSRMSGDYVYLFTNYDADIFAESSEVGTYIPYVNEKALEADDIFLPQTEGAMMHEVVTSVDIKDPDKAVDSKAILTKYGELYVSNEHIYWYEQNDIDGMETTIRKLSYKDGKIEAVAQGILNGYIHNSFSIDEYEGYLRVVTTSGQTEGQTNGIYILDADLKVIGSIEELAKNERVYSARLMGDTGYFVTFRETDPLFSVDLSDPTNPKILGELKIPGFSEYLHPYGENQLLGIGMEVDEETAVTSGLKLSMFDISDNTNVMEKNKHVLENVFSSDALYNYKAVLIDAGRNMIGFAAYEEGGQNYYIFSYDEEKGFECLMKERVNGDGYMGARGLYIDQVLYVVNGNIIEAYSLETYEKIDDLII